MPTEKNKQLLRDKARITLAKNRVRGVFSKARDSSFKTSQKTNFSNIRSGLKSSLLLARSELASAEYQEFLEWYSLLLRTMLSNATAQPDDFQYLSGFSAKAPEISLWKELRWTSIFISLHTEVLSEFCRYLLKVEDHILAGQYEDALDDISFLDNKYGHSFWSSQLRIAIAQESGGLELQKKVVANLREKHKRGVLAYIAYFTGVRNEDKTTWSHFSEIMDMRLSETPYPPELKTYLRFKLLYEFPQEDVGIADILRHELSNHPFDIYMTFIAVLQQMAKNPNFVHLKDEISNAIQALRPIEDFRIKRLAQTTELSTININRIEATKAVGAFFSSTDVKALRRAWKMTALSANKSPWVLACRAVVRAYGGNYQPPKNLPIKQSEKYLSSVIKRDKSAPTAIEQWRKNCRNFSGLPVFDGLREIENALGIVRLAPSSQSFRKIALNSQREGPELHFLTMGSEQKVDSSLQEEVFVSALTGGSPLSETQIKNLNASSKRISKCLHAYVTNDYEGVVSLVQKVPASDYVTSNLAAPFHMECLHRTRSKKELVEFVANRVASRSSDYLFLPVAEALGTFTKRDWKALRDDLSPLIALHAAWRLTDSDRLAATLRHELSAFLRKRDAGKPSDLLKSDHGLEHKKLVYFLRRICRPTFMDLIRGFQSSREVLEERRSIGGHLLELDPDRMEEYTVEVVQISSDLKIDEGLEMVDSSRIHVDGDAFRRWASRNVREDFERYTALVNAGLVAQTDVEQMLRDLLNELATRQAFYTPDDQADAILTNIYKRLGAQFLANSDFGLDYFLSKRIRHQSFIGLIRGPLEFASLITTRDSEFGSYRDNAFLQNKLQLNDENNRELQRILSEFAERFDNALVSLKDEILQIKSEEKPNGVFHIPINQRSLFVMRTLTQAGIEFETFLNSTSQLFWQSMEPCLDRAKHEIGVVLKNQLADLFTKLREDLRIIAEHSPSFSELSTQIVDTSVEVQRMLDRAAGWFVKPDTQPKGGIYTLEEGVDIAIASALTMHRAFDPKLDVNVDGHVDLQPPDLLLLWETIFVGMDNVKAHSGVKAGAKVELSCEYDADNVLKISITSELASKELSDIAKETLETISGIIERGEIGKASKKEGGSGFVKLASVLKHTPGGKLEYGLTKDKRFNLTVWFKPTKATVAILRLMDETTDS